MLSSQEKVVEESVDGDDDDEIGKDNKSVDDPGVHGVIIFLTTTPRDVNYPELDNRAY